MATDGKVIAVVGGALVVGGILVFSGAAQASEGKPSGSGKGRKLDTNAAQGYLPAVVKWAKQYGAPPSLIMAIMGNESGFNPNATNLTGNDLARGGAWGLTQITLKTGKGLYAGAKGLPAWDGTGPGLKSPDLNIAMAAYGIGANWRRFKGQPSNWLTAGVAWNTGAGAVDKHIKAGTVASWVQGHPYAIHIEQIRKTNPVVMELFDQEQGHGFSYT